MTITRRNLIRRAATAVAVAPLAAVPVALAARANPAADGAVETWTFRRVSPHYGFPDALVLEGPGGLQAGASLDVLSEPEARVRLFEEAARYFRRKADGTA